MWNRFAVENFGTFPVHRQSFQVFVGMLSRHQTPRSGTWNLLGTSGNVSDSPRASTPHQGMLHAWNQSAKGGNTVRDRTGKPVAICEQRNRETIPTRTGDGAPSEQMFSIASINSSINKSNTNQSCCRAIIGKTTSSSVEGKKSETVDQNVSCASTNIHILQCVSICKCEACH